MRRTRTLLAILLAMTLALPVHTALAASGGPTPLEISVTEDSCGPWTTCGTAVGKLGHATVVTEVTGFAPLPSGCFSDTHTSTLTFEDGSALALDVSGELCPTFTGFRFTGLYSVDGGASTARFSGATGSGLVRASRDAGPIHATFRGQLTLTQ